MKGKAARGTRHRETWSSHRAPGAAFPSESNSALGGCSGRQKPESGGQMSASVPAAEQAAGPQSGCAPLGVSPADQGKLSMYASRRLQTQTKQERNTRKISRKEQMCLTLRNITSHLNTEKRVLAKAP